MKAKKRKSIEIISIIFVFYALFSANRPTKRLRSSLLELLQASAGFQKFSEVELFSILNE
jgi:hypothetical protein